MAETTVIAAQQTSAPGWLQRFSDGQWPVFQEDLDREIARISEERGMRVISVSDALRRGPIPIHYVDDNGHMTGEVIAEAAQLYAYVEWEPLTNGDAPPAASERAMDA